MLFEFGLVVAGFVVGWVSCEIYIVFKKDRRW